MGRMHAPSLDLRWADLTGAQLMRADLTDAYLHHDDLAEANPEGADPCGSMLVKADLRKANLRGFNHSVARLTGTYFRQKDLGAADLAEADLTAATYDGQTMLPEGVDPQRDRRDSLSLGRFSNRPPRVASDAGCES